MSTSFSRTTIEQTKGAQQFLRSCLRELNNLSTNDKTLINTLIDTLDAAELLAPLYQRMLDIHATQDWSPLFRMLRPNHSDAIGTEMAALLCAQKSVHSSYLLSSKSVPDNVKDLHLRLMSAKSQIDFIERNSESHDSFSLSSQNVAKAISTYANMAGMAENLRILGVVSNYIPETDRGLDHARNFFSLPSIPDNWTVTKKLAAEFGVPEPVKETTQTPQEKLSVPLNDDVPVEDKLISTVWVLTRKLEQAQAAIDKMAANAKKMSLPPPTMSLTGNTRMISVPMPVSRETFRFLRGQVPRMRVSQTELVLTGETPRFKGVRLLAMVDHLPGGSTFVTHTSESAAKRLKESGIDVHSCDCNCDHCQVKRSRSTTFFVEDATGVKQIGSTCVDKFLGTTMLPQLMASLNNSKSILQEFEDEDYSPLKLTFGDIEVPHFLAMAQIITNTYGFVKSSEYNSTRELVLSVYSGALPNPPKEAIDLLLTNYEPDGNNPLFTDAENMIKVFLADTGTTDYILNLKKVLKLPHVALSGIRGTADMKIMGLLSSVPEAYRRYQERLAVSNAQNHGVKNEGFGNAKERGQLKLLCLQTNYYGNREFPSTVFKLKDDEGRLFRWNASGYNEEMEAGKHYLLTATIKDHKEYNDVTNTLLTRCQGFELVSADTPAPDFAAGAKTRKFKETSDFFTSVFNQNNEIDGDAHVVIRRNWRENDIVHDVNLNLPIDTVAQMTVTDILQLIASEVGLSRDVTPAKQDKAMAGLINDELSKIKQVPSLPEQFVVVSNVMSPILPLSNKASDRLSGVLRNPKDWSISALSDPAPWARHTAISVKNPKAVLAPSDLIAIPIEQQMEFRDKCFATGHHALVHMGRSGNISGIEPLALGKLAYGKEINVFDCSLHKTCHNIDGGSSRRTFGYNEFNYRQYKPFLGKEFVVIRMEDNTPEQYQQILDIMSSPQVCHTLLDAGLVPELLSAKHKLGSPNGTTLEWLDKVADFGAKKPLILLTDEASRLALREFGALVTTVCIGEVSLTQDEKPQIQLPQLGRDLDENNDIMMELARLWEIHNKPGSKLENIFKAAKLNSQ